MADEKLCGRCREVLPLTAFHRASREKSGYQQWCKVCRKGHDVEGRKQYHRERYHQQKDHYDNWNYLRRYGITLAQYNEMLESQGGVCYICKGACPTGRRLAVDHCHTTGKVRSLLCTQCNKGLGNFKDNSDLLEKAIEYLKQHGVER